MRWTINTKISCSHLTPGGFIEQAELSLVPKSDDGSIDANSMWDEFGKLVIECGVRFGKTMQIQQKMKNLIEEAGFVDVVEKTYKWPIGAWNNDPKLKDIGKWNLHLWKEGLEGWTMALLTRVMGVSYFFTFSAFFRTTNSVNVAQWSYNEVKEWNAKMRVTVRDRRYHAYQDV